MLSATIKYSILSNLLNQILAIREDAKVDITESGLSIKTVCSANVSMLATEFSNLSFESFSCEPTELGLDVEKFVDFLSLAKKDDIITLEHLKDSSKLIIEYAGLSYELALLSTDTVKSPRIPDLTLNAKATVPREKLLKIIKAAEKIDDIITFDINDISQIFSTSSSKDTDTMEGTITKDDITIPMEGSAHSIYSLDHLSAMIKTSTSPEINIKFGSDMPITITTPIDEHSSSTFLLAPRIES